MAPPGGSTANAVQARRLADNRPVLIGGKPMQSIKWSQHWMLLFVPVALVLEHVASVGAPVLFLVAALGDHSGRAPDQQQHGASFALHRRFHRRSAERDVRATSRN